MPETAIITAPTPKFVPHSELPEEQYRRYEKDAVIGDATEAQYFVFDKWATGKHQLIAGKSIRMAGSSPEHDLIQGEMHFEIKTALRARGSDCDTIGSDQKIYVTHGTIYYPDIAVICGIPQFDHWNALRNPTLVVEVASPSTEKSDRTDKFADYQKIESLQHCLLVEQDRVVITHYAKQDNGLWAIAGNYTTLVQVLKLSLGGGEIAIPLLNIYRRVFAPTKSV